MKKFNIKTADFPCPRCGGAVEEQWGALTCSACQGARPEGSIEPCPLHLKVWERHLEDAYWSTFCGRQCQDITPLELVGKTRKTAPLLPTGQPHLRWLDGAWRMTEF